MEFNSDHPSWNYETTATGNSSRFSVGWLGAEK